jgi:hypothetical protein
MTVRPITTVPGTLALALCVCLSQAGCAGYKLGATAPAGFTSIAVPMFRNNTLVPQMEGQITGAVIRYFQTDGGLRIERSEDADVVLTGQITRYSRSAMRFERGDSNTPREYRIHVTVKVQATDRRTGAVVLKSTNVTGQADVFVGSDQQSAEMQVLPLVAEDIAKQVVALIAEPW